MLANLLFFLFFETVEPSYGTFAEIMPQQVIAPAVAEIKLNGAPALNIRNAPVKTGKSTAPVVEAKSVFSIDLKSGAPLFANNIFERRKIASIEKLLTAMIILDEHKLDEKTVVSRKAASQEGSTMGLQENEQITVKNLLIGMLVNSGNDAAVALAEYNAGDEASFVAKMNTKARRLGLKNTHFSNAKGFDDDENYSTAFDTALFSRAALEYPFIRKTAMIKNAEVSSLNGRIKHILENTNDLLENPYFKIKGLKTGKTPEAGQSFVSLAEDPKGNEILTVVLDSPDRFKETKIILDWIFRNYAFSGN